MKQLELEIILLIEINWIKNDKCHKYLIYGTRIKKKTK